MDRRLAGYSLLAGVGLYVFAAMVIDLDILPFINITPNTQVSLSVVLVGPLVYIEEAVGIMSGGITALAGLALFLVSLTVIRSSSLGRRKSILQTVCLITPAIIFVFSLDFVSLDPGDFHNTVIFYFYQVGLTWVTNELALIISGVWLIVGVLVFKLKK